MLKKVGIIVGASITLLIIIIGISLVNHKVQLAKEDKYFIPSGTMVNVNGHKLHVYTQGEGHETLVFMSGGGTSCPVLDFKSLYSLLSDQYKIVVIEKAGYGFSEISDVSRDVDTMLEETRQALHLAGLQEPYILFPHSMSGIEAFHWAKKYPQEVKALVGLDMAVPEIYEDYWVNGFILQLGGFAARIGFTRLIPQIVDESAAIKYGSLTEEEKNLYRTVFYRRTSTKTMLREVSEIKSNAEKVKGNGMPHLPILFFISNGEGTGWDKEEWVEAQRSYIENTNTNKYINLDCSHYVHNIESEAIAAESKVFIEGLKNQ